jgi:NAD(P)-dependent dehydrogenase (short-subunit alcohol dehydrogenase family)
VGMLDGKVALVTGGGSGIGKGIAQALAGEGCTVVLASRNAERLAAAVDAICEAGGTAVSVVADVTNETQVKALFGEVTERYGRLDILVNSPGAFEGGRIDTLSLETWHRVLDTNLTGPFLCTREAFAIMKEAGGGRIINVGSISAHRARMHSAPYTSSKFGIWGLTQCTALDGREFGIAASCIQPGNTLVERRGDLRTHSGRDEGPEPMISVDEVARVALVMATLPPGANLLEATILPVTQPYVGRG